MSDETNNNTDERRRLVQETAQKQLAEGNWPEVIAIFSYENPNAPRIPTEEYSRLTNVFRAAGHLNLVKFIEILAFNETANNVTMSFNFSMRRRLSAEEAAKATSEQMSDFMSTPDILVGTRRSIEGAGVWLSNLAEAMPDLIPESVQIMDKIFGDANLRLSEPGEKTTYAEMFERVLSGAPKPDKPKTLKH